METLFEEEFVNKKFLSFMKAKIEQEQLDQTINELDYLNKVQSLKNLKNSDNSDETTKTINLNNAK